MDSCPIKQKISDHITGQHPKNKWPSTLRFTDVSRTGFSCFLCMYIFTFPEHYRVYSHQHERGTLKSPSQSHEETNSYYKTKQANLPFLNHKKTTRMLRVNFSTMMVIAYRNLDWIGAYSGSRFKKVC